MNKADIIEKTLKEMKLLPLKAEPPISDEPDEEEFIVSVLRDLLPEGVDIRTCEDFKQLQVECCQTCHDLYPHYDMSLTNLADGGKAWVCDNVKWAIYPEEHRKLQEWSGNSPEGKVLKQIFPEDVTNRLLPESKNRS